jgi:predicted regulator of Ras-like GTPase activity (Roadblock/LC7/MglB family)
MNTQDKKPQDGTRAATGGPRSDRKLRDDALVFYQEDMDAIQTILDAFLKQSAARCALLVDQDGHMITARGETTAVDLDTISALVAGSFAATKALAKQFGDTDFTALFHQGRSGNIQLSLVGERALLTALFGDDTTIGMVRLYANEASKRLANIFRKKAASRGTTPPPSAADDARFTQGAADALNNVLG